ncbi:anthranilate synthase component I [Bacillus sp. REN16]|uniref:anthranilate synthase component I n=1 Tax=Bacillus sp. REN16 TaxID=2887296 RepID=UPI001E2E01FB|nr:anthranilate synthase component I [Bacillus sp. REN16]MCC3358326.1 anthranilate synthase component I [Bacillus sp. REN16]
MNTYNFSSFASDAKQYRTIPIVKRFLVDTLTPIQIFQNLKNEASFLLESKDHESDWSRYSFIGLKPFLFMDESNGLYYVKNENQQSLVKKPTMKDAFNWIKDYLVLKPLDIEIPFYGGAVGYIGYDAISTFEKVEEHSNNDLNMERYQFFFCETILALDHQSRELIVVHFIRLNGGEDERIQKAVYEHAHSKINMYLSRIIQNKEQSEMLLLPKLHEIPNVTDIKTNFEKQDFLDAVDKIKDYITAGDIFQAVLSQRFEIPVSVSGFQLYRVLRMVNPSPYLFYIKINDIEIVGSSPERLIKIHQKHLEIHPIAGTRRRGKTKEEDELLATELLQDEKEKAEHYMLVDLARNDIGRVSTFGSVKTPVLMEIGRFSHVMHIISKVTGELDEKIDPLDALLAAFPAGTVSGAPKIRAMQILSELEPTARNLYAGAIAYIGFDGNIDSCITIRTAIIKDGIAYVQSGAGIVADSVPEHEWMETVNKASALIQTIQLAEEAFNIIQQ